ncbi:MAG: MtrB/PioB family outer membrane beta-barrel protein [Gemmatimonadota bacterium]|nr:MtrB/PioB family outer membrane beta-barrel protein [Gemmatimonadota bacterium]
MRTLIACLTLAALPVAVAAQGAATPVKAPTKATATAAPAGNGGTISIGFQQVDNNTNSSVLTEYRDLRDGRTPLALRYSAKTASGLYFSVAGADVTRSDQSLGMAVGKPGIWRLKATWDELPHDLSHKAMSPYSSSTPGVLDLSQTMAITFKKLATGSADAPSVVASDAIAAAYLTQFARPVELGTTLKNGGFELQYSGIKAMNFTFGYTQRAKSGSKIGYGPIGDRPPRSLNIQFAEPVDYATGDLKAAAEWVTPRYQVRAEYLRSEFENEIDVLKWRNVWASAPAGAAYDTWDRAVAVYGVRPLAPDNTYQSVMFSGGVALPFASRLTASVLRGTMEQDGALLPYAYQNDLLVNKTLPRSSTQGKMETTALAAEYSIAPLPYVNVRGFAKHFELANHTPSAQWQYVTQDAPSLTGTVSYVNKRVNEEFAWDRSNLGVESTIRVPALKGSLVVAFEHEDFGREHLEAAETGENTFRLGWNGRPTKWLALRAKVLRGTLDAGEYNWRAASASYWYSSAEANDNNNPRFTFENHPDMRAYTMADRARTDVDLMLTVTPTSALSVSTRFKSRDDDFDSDVTSIKPLMGLAVADQMAATPGKQLGLLKRTQQQLSLDVTYAPTERLAVSASYGRDVGTSDMRGIEFNENNKMNPSAINTAILGPWTRESSEWTAAFDDRNVFAMFGGTYELVPGKMTLAATVSSSRADMDIVYGGFGLVSFDGTPIASNNEYGFQTPPTVQQRMTVSDLSLVAPLFGRMEGRIGLRNEKFTLDDWQQSTGTLQFETVGGTDLLLRDTSRSHQWGNRLPNLGSYLAPSFAGTSVYVGITYGFGGAK